MRPRADAAVRRAAALMLLALVEARGDGALPRAADAAALACRLSPAHAGAEHRRWWDAVPRDARYRRWLWKAILPERGDDDPCRAGARATFWAHAVPEEWAPVADLGGWGARGGYYAQTLWLRAVPRGWAPVAARAGWPDRRGGYYAQTLWLDAVPDDWGTRRDLALGHGVLRVAGQGWYRWVLWERAVPEGWPPAVAGYYTRTFWLRAVPEGWAPRADLAVTGAPGRGWYDFWLHHFAAVRGFAWRPAPPALAGGAGYYDTTLHDVLARRHPHYAERVEVAAAPIAATAHAAPAPVDRWFAPDARAVVVLSFDTEGTRDAVVTETCAVADVLRAHGVPGTFFVVAAIAELVTADPAWQACLAGFEVANHTYRHPGRRDLVPRSMLAALPAVELTAEIGHADAVLRRLFPAASPTSFRSPYCDSIRAFDGSVAAGLAATRSLAGDRTILADSSVVTVPAASRALGIVPPAGLARWALAARPHPYVLGGGVVELPFAYPSDWTAVDYHALDPRGAPLAGAAETYAATVWKRAVDEAIGQRGVVVLTLHPWLQAPGGLYPEALADVIAHARAQPGVYFATVGEVAARFGG
jgi:peptidoglycan/xylan/chitin deacetylase (PgdA/CDA1 family)